MNKKGHFILGIVMGLFLIFITDLLGAGWYVFSLKSIIIMSVIVLFYSILPDMDHPAGTMTWWFLGVGILGLTIGVIQLVFRIGDFKGLFVVSTLFLIVVFISGKVLKHRGFIHTIQAGILSVIPLWYIFNDFSYCVLGYVAWHSHLMGDGYLWKIR